MVFVWRDYCFASEDLTGMSLGIPEFYLSTSPLTSKDRRGLVNILKNLPGWLVNIIKHVGSTNYRIST